MIYLYVYLIGVVVLFLIALVLPERPFNYVFDDSPVFVVFAWPLVLLLALTGVVINAGTYMDKVINRIRKFTAP